MIADTVEYKTSNGSMLHSEDGGLRTFILISSPPLTPYNTT